MSSPPESPISKNLAVDVARESAQRFADFQKGMAIYLQADVPEWQSSAQMSATSRQMSATPQQMSANVGNSRLLDYGGEGEVVLLVPSLINRANILDLSRELSLARKLSEGAHVYLLDWGDAEADFGLEDYAARLSYFAQTIAQPGDHVHLVGYCMGGLVALRASLDFAPKSITLLATPWDFDYMRSNAAGLLDSVRSIPSNLIPPQILQNMFFSIAPWRVLNKFAELPRMATAAQAKFCLIEKWANDGVALPKKLLLDCLENWIGNGDLGFSLAEISTPVFAACPMNDKIVPLSSSTVVADELGSCEVKQYDCGHIGLVVKDLIVDDVFSWINSNK